MNDVELIAKKLIFFPSITPDDAGALDYIKELLESAGFLVIIQQFESSDCTVSNLYAERGEEGANLCFAGHIDVVDPIDNSLWDHDPFIPYEKDGILYGRGASDMKGALAASIAAALSVDPKEQKGKISFLITSDEEYGRYEGTQAMLEWLYSNGYKIDFAIVGEPTCEERLGDVIKIGRRGSINFTLSVNGIAGHVAYPEKALNPVPISSKIIEALYNLKLDDGNNYFDKSNLEVTNIDIGNNTSNVIPAIVKIFFNVRFNNFHSAEGLLKIVGDAVSSLYHDYNLSFTCSSHPFLVDKIDFHDEFAKIVEENCGIVPKFATNGGTSDARFIKNYCNLLEFGALNESAHKINEFINFSDLQTLKNVYYEAILRFCKLS